MVVCVQGEMCNLAVIRFRTTSEPSPSIHWIHQVLEALNRLLDHNRELYLPETQETIKPHPSFRLFATQNPPGAYGGRKPLSRAFRNRFMEVCYAHEVDVSFRAMHGRRPGTFIGNPSIFVSTVWGPKCFTVRAFGRPCHRQVRPLIMQARQQACTRVLPVEQQRKMLGNLGEPEIPIGRVRCRDFLHMRE